MATLVFMLQCIISLRMICFFCRWLMFRTLSPLLDKIAQGASSECLWRRMLLVSIMRASTAPLFKPHTDNKMWNIGVRDIYDQLRATATTRKVSKRQLTTISDRPWCKERFASSKLTCNILIDRGDFVLSSFYFRTKLLRLHLGKKWILQYFVTSKSKPPEQKDQRTCRPAHGQG